MREYRISLASQGGECRAELAADEASVIAPRQFESAAGFGSAGIEFIDEMMAAVCLRKRSLKRSKQRQKFGIAADRCRQLSYNAA
jgi:hypothetical protein